MRRAILLRSVARAAPEAGSVLDAAYMWARHRWMVPYTAASFVGMMIVAVAVGWSDWSARIGLGAAAAAVAVMATTEYRVLAQTETGLSLLKASRIRQYATQLLEKLPGDVSIEPSGGSVLAADWTVGDRRFTVPRSSEQAMRRIAGAS